jgi:putative Holliday junction resolvase
MRILAIDAGERRLGVAVSDPSEAIAQPLEVVLRRGWAKDIAHVRALVQQYEIGEVVVGRPLTLRGEAGPEAARAAGVAARLRDALEVPVIEVDERFTTAAADRAMREGGQPASKRRRRRDAVAAALILQPYLDRRHRRRAGVATRG